MSVALKCTFDTKSAVQLKAAEAQSASPKDAPKALLAYTNPIWIVMRNKTQFDINLEGSPQFWSGTMHGETPGAAAYSVSSFGVHNRTKFFAMGYGVLGGMHFSIDFDGQNEFHFCIGFSNPVAGGYKAKIVETMNPSEVYNAKDMGAGNAIKSANKYTGVDKNDDPLSFTLSLAATAGGNPMTFTISQNMMQIS